MAAVACLATAACRTATVALDFTAMACPLAAILAGAFRTAALVALASTTTVALVAKAALAAEALRERMWEEAGVGSQAAVVVASQAALATILMAAGEVAHPTCMAPWCLARPTTMVTA